MLNTSIILYFYEEGDLTSSVWKAAPILGIWLESVHLVIFTISEWRLGEA